MASNSQDDVLSVSLTASRASVLWILTTRLLSRSLKPKRLLSLGLLKRKRHSAGESR